MEASTFERIVALVLGLIVLLFTAYTQFMISGFLEVFLDIGKELPQSTRLIFATYRWWLLLALAAVVGVYLVTFRQRKLGWWPLGVSVFLAAILLPFTVWSMYAPVMQ